MDLFKKRMFSPRSTFGYAYGSRNFCSNKTSPNDHIGAFRMLKAALFHRGRLPTKCTAYQRSRWVDNVYCELTIDCHLPMPPLALLNRCTFLVDGPIGSAMSREGPHLRVYATFACTLQYNLCAARRSAVSLKPLTTPWS